MRDWVIIDGYNLIHQVSTEPQAHDFPRLRAELIKRMEALVNVIARRITLVFDGKFKEHPGSVSESRIIEVIYSSDRSADGVIENLVWKAGHPEGILVVTSDRLIRDAAAARGADTMASSLFAAMIDEQSAGLADQINKINKRHDKTTLGDLFPTAKNG